MSTQLLAFGKFIALALVLGWVILLTAIILNYFARLVGLMTWYDFLNAPAKAGVVAYIWLFLIYPLCLGLVGRVAWRMIWG